MRKKTSTKLVSQHGPFTVKRAGPDTYDVSRSGPKGPLTLEQLAELAVAARLAYLREAGEAAEK